jgi:hypothetical protein
MCLLAMLVTAHAGSLVGLDVLDIRCTWRGGAEGARSYLGLGSPDDVHRVAAEHPHVPTLCARVAYFVPREPVRFDVVVCGGDPSHAFRAGTPSAARRASGGRR